MKPPSNARESLLALVAKVRAIEDTDEDSWRALRLKSRVAVVVDLHPGRGIRFPLVISRTASVENLRDFAARGLVRLAENLDSRKWRDLTRRAERRMLGLALALQAQATRRKYGQDAI